MRPNRLFQLATHPQITMQWANFDGTPTVYLTTDPGLNRITLTLTNNLGHTIVIDPSDPEEPGLSLYFGGLLTNAEVEGIQVTFVGAMGWKTVARHPDDGLAYLVLTPDGPLEVPDGKALEFELTQVLAAATRSGQVIVTVAGHNPQVFVNVQSQPAVGNQALDLVVGFGGSGLVTTGGGTNDLTLYLTNPNATPLVPGGAAQWGPDPPTFQLSLVFGDTQGALTTLADAAGIAVNLADAYGNIWKPVAAQQQGVFPTWFLQPDPIGGGQVLGAGDSATIAFAITGIVTSLPQGLTLAFLSCANLPGYNDGFYALEIVKVDPVVIVSFYVASTGGSASSGLAGGRDEHELAPRREPLVPHPITVNLEFAVQNATYVSITNTEYATATGSTDFFQDLASVKIYATTTFTLLAYNFATGQQVAQSLQFSVSPDLYQLVPIGTIVMWSGLQASVPFGWAICDGSKLNGLTTPILTNCFIQGADPTVEGQQNLPQGPVGGSSLSPDTHTHVINSASLAGTTSVAGNHYHSTQIATCTTTLGGNSSVWALAATAQGQGDNATNTFDSNTAGDHTHTITLQTQTVTSQIQDTASLMRPQWYALYFIMKCY